MSYNYSSEITAAQTAIAKFGALGYLVRNKVVGTAPIWTVIDRYSPIERQNTEIRYTDYKALVSGSDLSPLVPDAEIDQFQFDVNQPNANTFVGDLPLGIPIRIVTVTPIAPGGINILFELQVRR